MDQTASCAVVEVGRTPACLGSQDVGGAGVVAVEGVAVAVGGVAGPAEGRGTCWGSSCGCLSRRSVVPVYRAGQCRWNIRG